MGDEAAAGDKVRSGTAAGRGAGQPPPVAPAFYARGRGPLRDIRALLHPPYTAWHLSYVVLGGLSGHHVNWTTLVATLLAFFLAVGVAAHALDELNGRPLATTVPVTALVVSATFGLGGAVALGAVGVARVGAPLIAFIVVGAFLVVSYNLEWLGGRVHTDLGFALAWGAFPVLTAAYAENRSLPPAAVAIAVAAAFLSAAQRSLSTPARTLRRRATSVSGEVTMADGRVAPLDRGTLLAPVERALRYLSLATVALAVGLVVLRLQVV